MQGITPHLWFDTEAVEAARFYCDTFPGSLDDHDAAVAIERCGGEPETLWHADAELKAAVREQREWLMESLEYPLPPAP